MVALAMTLAIVTGTAVLGFMAASVVPAAAWSNPGRAIAAMIGQGLSVVALGTLVGAFGWGVMFALRRDGWHRMEWVALLPFNYDGHDPFDTSDWSAGSQRS